MPIYEYACAKCESEFEVEQRITDDPVKTCPQCRSRKVKRLISRTSFVLKGGGWYSDLYSSNNNASEKSEGAGDSGGESSGGDAKEAKASDGSDAKDKKKDSKDKKAKKGGKKTPKAAA